MGIAIGEASLEAKMRTVQKPLLFYTKIYMIFIARSLLFIQFRKKNTKWWENENRNLEGNFVIPKKDNFFDKQTEKFIQSDFIVSIYHTNQFRITIILQ